MARAADVELELPIENSSAHGFRGKDFTIIALEYDVGFRPAHNPDEPAGIC